MSDYERAEAAEKALAVAERNARASGYIDGCKESLAERDDLRAKLAAATYPTRDEGALAHRDSLEAKLAEAEAKLAAAEAEQASQAIHERDAVKAENSGLLGAYGELEAKADGVWRVLEKTVAERDAALARVREYDKALLTVHDVNMRHEARVAALEGALRGLKAHSPYCDSAGSCCNDYRAADEHARRVLEGKHE